MSESYCGIPGGADLYGTRSVGNIANYMSPKLGLPDLHKTRCYKMFDLMSIAIALFLREAAEQGVSGRRAAAGCAPPPRADDTCVGRGAAMFTDAYPAAVNAGKQNLHPGDAAKKTGSAIDNMLATFPTPLWQQIAKCAADGQCDITVVNGKTQSTTAVNVWDAMGLPSTDVTHGFFLCQGDAASRLGIDHWTSTLSLNGATVRLYTTATGLLHLLIPREHSAHSMYNPGLKPRYVQTSLANALVIVSLQVGHFFTPRKAVLAEFAEWLQRSAGLSASDLGRGGRAVVFNERYAIDEDEYAAEATTAGNPEAAAAHTEAADGYRAAAAAASKAYSDLSESPPLSRLALGGGSPAVASLRHAVLPPSRAVADSAGGRGRGGHAVVGPLTAAAESKRLAGDARERGDEEEATMHDAKATALSATAAAASKAYSARMSAAGECAWNRTAACYFHSGRSLIIAALTRRKAVYTCKFCRHGALETRGTACDACKNLKNPQKR